MERTKEFWLSLMLFLKREYKNAPKDEMERRLKLGSGNMQTRTKSPVYKKTMK